MKMEMVKMVKNYVSDETKSQCLGYVLAIPAILHSYNVGKRCKAGEISKSKAVAKIYGWSLVAGLTAGIVTYLSYLYLGRKRDAEQDLVNTTNLVNDDEIDAEKELNF